MSFACEFRLSTPTKFDKNEYVFTAEVIDIVGPLQDNNITGDAYGILVKVKEIVYLPDSSTDSFEVYPYSYTPACTPEGLPKEWLLPRYPKGLEVNVVASKSCFSKAGGKRIMLDAPETSGYGVMGVVSDSVINTLGALNKHIHLCFYLRKDLLKLERASSDYEKAAILRNYMGNGNYSERWFSKMTNIYITSESLRTNLTNEFIGKTPKPIEKPTVEKK